MEKSAEDVEFRMIQSPEVLLNKLYSSALLDGGLSGVLADLAKAYPDLPISYQAQCVFKNELYDCAMYNHGPDAELHLAMAETANPFPPLALTCDVSEVSITAHSILPEEVERTDFYHEFLASHCNINRAFGIVLHRHGNDSAFIAANLPKELGEKEEAHVLDVMRFLRPHCQGAFQLLLEVNRREIEGETHGFWLEQIPTAAFVVTNSRKVLHLNGNAERLLRSRPELQITKGSYLSSPDMEIRSALGAVIHEAFAHGLPAGPVPLGRTGIGGCIAYVLPIKTRDQVHPTLAPFLSHSLPLLVTIFDPADRPPSDLSVLEVGLGLSARESALLQELIMGATVREAAERMGVSYNTARNQLASAHAKTGSRSQSELVRLGTQMLARLPKGR